MLALRNKHGGASKVLRATMAAALVTGLLPITALSSEQKAYADEGDGTRNAPLSEYIEQNIDEGIAPVKADSGLLAFLRGLVDPGAGNLDKTSCALVVKNTMVDGATVKDGDGFETIYASEDRVAESLLGQFEAVAPVYDPGEDSDYYVAFADTAGMGGAAKVIDWQAAEFNILGQTIEGLVYDYDTGIVYIPKDIYAENDQRIVQLQLLCSYDFGTAESNIDVRIESANSDVTAVAAAASVKVAAMDVTVDVPVATPETAAAIDGSDIEVFVNGSEAPMNPENGDAISYNTETGILTVACNGASVATLDVKINPRGWLEPERAYAVTPDSMRAIKDMYGNQAELTKLDPDLVSAGQTYTYTGFLQYFSADTSERRHQVLTTLWDSLYVGDIQNELISGSGFTFDQIWNPKDEGYSQVLGDSGNGGFDLVNTFDWPNASRTYGSYDDEGDPVYSGNNVIGGVDWTGFPKTNDTYRTGWQGVAMCAHIGQNGWVEKVPNGDTSDFVGSITMRVLHKADDYLVLGFVLPTINTQTGAAVYKVKYAAKGDIEIQKSSANEAITSGNSCYTFEGIKYGVYADAGCTSLAATLTLDASGYAKAEDLKRGTYWVKEISTNGSYAISDQVQKVEIASNAVARVEVKDEPLDDPDGLILRKVDADTGAFVPTGNGSLALAEYTFEYIDGYAYNSEQFDKMKATSKAKRTWVLRTNGNGYTDLGYGNDSFEFEGKNYDYKVSGDPFFMDGSRVTVPLGTVRIHETKSPEGYNLSEAVYIIRVVASSDGYGAVIEGDNELIQDGNTPTLATKADEAPIRGGVIIYKRDAETKQEVPQPGTDWNGVAFEIVNRSAAEVTYDGVKVPVGGVVTTIKTDAASGMATTGPNKLQFGTYGIREVATSDAYIMSDTDERTFEIREQGQMIVLDGDDAVYNQLKRGDLEFVKVTERNPERLAGVPFLITNKASGEAHVIVTDANGQAKTAAQWNGHTVSTNANDAAVDANGDGVFSDEEKAAVDESKLNANAGIWFGHDAEGNMAAGANDSLGALPYGDYTVEELRVHANRLYELVSFDLSVRRHDVSIDLGTITDHRPDVKIPWIGTSARDAADGDKLLVCDPEATVIDRIEYANLDAGELYRMVGVLMDKGTGEPVRDEAGNPITAEKTFAAEDVRGFVELTFGFDATTVEGDVVVFETLYKDGVEEPAAEHEDIDDYYQTVKIYKPAIGTTLTDAADGDKKIVADETVKLVDTVAYTNMPKGKEVTIEGTLMVKGNADTETAPLVKPVLDADGNPAIDENGTALTEPVTGTVTFVPEAENGTVDVVFEFPGSCVTDGMVLVAYEHAWRVGKEIATHDDPEDPAQTVVVAGPEIGTLASDAADGDKELEAAEDVTINDAVSYQNLIPGKEYTLVATVMAKDDKGAASPLKDAEGNAYTVEHAFVPEASDGVEVVSVTIDAKELAGADLVMYEQLLLEGKIIASHEDPEDEGQTVHVTEPKIGTTATDKSDGDHKLIAGHDAVIVDEIAYTGLIPGKEYVIKGVLMDKETGKPLIAGDTEVRAEKRFTPNKPAGTVTIEFAFDAAALGGKTVVAFEDLYKDGKLVATHSDIEDAAQTVEIVTPLPGTGESTPGPKAGTFAKAGVDLIPIAAIAVALIAVGCALYFVGRARSQAICVKETEAKAAEDASEKEAE